MFSNNFKMLYYIYISSNKIFYLYIFSSWFSREKKMMFKLAKKQ